MTDTPESLRAATAEALKIADPTQQKAALDALEGRYKTVHGDRPVEIGGVAAGSAQAGPPPTGEQQDQSFYQESLAECDRACRAEWGDRYEANMTLIRETAVELLTGAFPEPGKADLMVEKVAGAFFEAGGTMADMNRLLLRIAKRGSPA